MEKTCGNCHWYHEDSRGIGIGACLNMNSERMCNGNFFPVAHAGNYPCNQHVSETNTLEQRYQQLEQVATNAIQLLEIIEDELGAESIFTVDETHEKWSAKVFRDQLEELGVAL